MTPAGTGSGRDPRQEHMSVNAEGADNARMGVLGQGQQWNIFGGTDNHDVVVVIEHERDEIAVEIDTPTRLSVEITNHTGHVKHLSLRANGVPSGIATLDRTEVVVRPGETSWVRLTLRCTATTPKAGRRPLQVVAVEQGSGMQWPSSAKTIAIPSRPDVRLALAGPENVTVAGTYPARVQVSNFGNTMVEGHVRSYEQRSTGTLTPGMSFPGGRGRAAEFHGTPGESAELGLQLTFPTQGWRRRRWEMLFQLTVDRDDVPDTYHRFEVEQQGRLAELWLAILQKHDLRAGVLRRSALVSGLAVVLVVVTVFALIAGLPPDEREAGSRPTTSTAEERLSGGLAVPDIYRPLPCAPGQWIVFLGTMVGKHSDDEARFVFAHETARLEWVLEHETDRFEYIVPGSTFTVRASGMDDVCPDTKEYVGEASADRRFVWLEPFVRSEAEATQVCVDIGKPLKYDCLPWPAG
jgi:hypothetical protein